MSRFGMTESELPADSSLRRWHPAFALDTAVSEVEPAPLPPRPASAGGDEKITSAREAVAAFRARALFREATLCEKLAPPTTAESLPPKAPLPLTTTTAKPSTATQLKGVSASLLARVSLQDVN